ncbi:MAG TPA: phosphatase PAP2 family protein [Terrimicrobiaceae bacterium]
MKETHTRKEESQAAARQAGRALEAGFAEVKTPSEAAKVLDSIEEAASETKEKDLPQAQDSVDPVKQAEAIKEAAATAPPTQRAAVVLTEAAAQIAASPVKKREALDEAVAEASGQAPSKDESPQVEHGRDLLRKELINRLKPFDAIDAALFIRINHLPHPKWFDGLIARFSWIMTGGHAWILVVLADALGDRHRAVKTARAVLPALYLATYTVEIPIKRYFRRRRPFISIVRAIVVGRKPGSHSFPSGHSAAAFAGATLLQAHYPRGRRLFFAIALLVAFSRVYLGAHYPGDVLSGSLAGSALAKLYQSLLKRLK